MTSLPELISGYLDNELEQQDVDFLADSLRADSETVDQLVLHSFIHSQLSEWMSLRPTRDELLVDAFDGLGLANSANAVARQDDGLDRAWSESSALPGRRSSGKRTPRAWLRMMAAMAAVLLIAALGVTAITMFVSRPTIVAQLTQTSGCQWHPSQPDIPVGTLLEDGQQLQLVSGRALITFISGAQIVLDGQSILRLVSPTEADLQRGKITAKVPTQAIGFKVSSPSASFVDLGTEFTVTLDSDEAFELQVFDGLVELQLAERFSDAEPRRLRISAGSAVRFDAEARDISTVPYDEGQRMSL